MKLRELWEKNIHWVLVLWLLYSLFFTPGWVAFAIGMAVWLLLLILTAPGVFWTYVYLLPSNTRYDLEPNIARLRKVMAMQPLIPLPYASLGIMCAKAKRWREAVAPLETAIRLASKKDRIELKILLAVALRELGEYDRTFQILDELVAQGVKTVKIFYNYALSYLRLERYDEALEAVQKARALDLRAAEPVILMAKIRFNMGDYEGARNDYEWAITHTNWPVESFYWLGRAELELGLAAQAVGHLEKAVERITDDPDLSDVTAAEAGEWLEKARTIAGTGVVDEKHDFSET
jgi:tetratricopeptide (TPR) repeat protein